MGDIKVGDTVTSRDGCATTVTGVYPQGFKKIVRVNFSDGVHVECCSEHLWSVSTDRAQSWTTMSTSQISHFSSKFPATLNSLEIPLVSPVEFSPLTTPLVDPYLFGLVLGALTAYQNSSEFVEYDILPLTLENWSDFKFYESVLPNGILLPPSSLSSPNFNHQLCTGFRWRDLKSILSLADSSSNTTFYKLSIPLPFLRASIPSRLALLRGFCDSTAHCDWSNGVPKLHICSPSPSFSVSIVELVQSLGGTASRISDLSLGQTELLDFRLALNPFSLPRKARLFEKLSSELRPQRYISSVTSLREDQCLCISVSAKDCLYITDYFVVTHNTIQAIAATAMYQPEWPVLVFTPSSARYHWKVLSYL